MSWYRAVHDEGSITYEAEHLAVARRAALRWAQPFANDDLLRVDLYVLDENVWVRISSDWIEPVGSTDQ